MEGVPFHGIHSHMMSCSDSIWSKERERGGPGGGWGEGDGRVEDNASEGNVGEGRMGQD